MKNSVIILTPVYSDTLESLSYFKESCDFFVVTELCRELNEDLIKQVCSDIKGD